MSYQDIKDLTPGAPAPGWSDVATGPKTATAGQAISSSDDLVQVVANFDQARPGSFIACARDAAQRVGSGIPLVAISLVAAMRGQKKPECVRRVPLPAAVLCNQRAVLAAQGVVELRRQGARGKPVGLGVEAYEDWLEEGHDPREVLWDIHRGLVGHASAALNFATRTGVEQRFRITTTAAKIVTRWEATMPELSDDDDDRPTGDDVPGVDDIFGDELFVTADSPGRPAVSTEDDPAEALVRRLRGYALNKNHRGTLATLRRYAIAPDPTNVAMNTATRDIPMEHYHIATTVAALFAVWQHAHPASAWGMTPLARVARAFGAGKNRGPSNANVRAQFARVLAVGEPQNLLPVLLPWINSAGADTKARPDWVGLYRDILDWKSPGKPVQTRWGMLFYRNNKIEDIDAIVKKGLIVR
jgi:CRISPR type I-E-associated protein CasB/Cse2